MSCFADEVHTFKVCSKCGCEKPRSEFGVNKQGRDGLRAQCNACRKVQQAAWYVDNKAAHSARCESWRQRNSARDKAAGKKWREENKDRLREKEACYRQSDKRKSYAKGYSERNKERLSELRSAWYEKNKAVCLARSRQWYQENKGRHAETGANWCAKNRMKVRQRSANRRARKILATPKWADNTMIEATYSAAESLSTLLGVTLEVDHVVPLISPIVCGLHCQDNLQLLPQADNRSKGNREWPDCP